MERSETLGVGYRVAPLFIVIAVFNFSFAKSGFVNLTWWMTILQSLAGCSAGWGVRLQVCRLNGDGSMELSVRSFAEGLGRLKAYPFSSRSTSRNSFMASFVPLCCR
jgi:hypothetical protein